MSRPAFDRTTLHFAARRVVQGIQLSARFDAPKLSTGEPGSYRLHMTVDPKTRVFKHSKFTFHRVGAEHLVPHESGLDKLRPWAEKIRDLFLKSPAWEALKDREPDPKYWVDQEGKISIKDRRNVL
jgi:hypothetical protein